MLAPLGATRWEFEDRVLQATDGLVFELALAGDFDDDPARDVIAWLSVDPAAKPTPDRATPPASLWFYPGQGEPRKLLDTPGFLPTGPGCKLTAKLNRSGPGSVTLETRASCDPPQLGNMPNRALSVVAPAREEPHLLTLRIADKPGQGDEASTAPAPNEQLNFSISTADRDEDGRDDIDLSVELGNTLSLGATSEPSETSVQFVWLDRKVGLSRDTEFPSKNFHDIGSIEVVRSTGKNTSQATIARIDTVRRLVAALCAEAKVPVLRDQDNNPLPCNLSQQTLAFFAKAELQATLTRGRWGDALTSLLRAEWYGGGLSKANKDELMAILQKSLPEKKVGSIALSRTRPSGPSSIPRYSPLGFDNLGLLIQTADGVTRLDLDTLDETDVSEEVDRWPLVVISPQGERLLGMAYPCDRPVLTLLTSDASGAVGAPIETRLLSPRPGLCGSTRANFEELPLRPVGWSKAGLSVFLAGSEVGAPAPSRPVRGSARSANGEHAAVATSLGVLVLHQSGAELWRSEEAPSKNLSECVIDNPGTHVACLDRGRARVLAEHSQAP